MEPFDCWTLSGAGQRADTSKDENVTSSKPGSILLDNRHTTAFLGCSADCNEVFVLAGDDLLVGILSAKRALA